MPYNGKKRKKSYKKALGVRGGFTPRNIPKSFPRGAGRAFVSRTKGKIFASAKQYGEDFLKGWATKATQDIYDKFADSLKDYDLPSSEKVGDAIVGTMKRMASASGTGGEGTVPFLQTENQYRRRAGSDRDTSRRYVTSIVSGKPSSRGLKALARQNGKKTIVKRDSLMDYAVDNAQRTQFERVHGFNQKHWSTFNLSGFTQEILNQMYDTQNIVYDSARPTVMYAGILNFQQMFKIYNHNSFFRSKVKIYMLRPKVSGFSRVDTSDIIPFLSGTSSDLTTELGVGKIPKSMQLKGRTEGSTVSSVLVDPQASLTMGEEFRDSFEVVRTFSKILAPSDVWEFKHRTHCGAGIDLLAAREREAVNENLPIGYMYLIEQVGMNCVAKQNQSPFNSIIGTSPGDCQVEWKLTVEAVLQSISGSDVQKTGTGGGIKGTTYQIRVFTKNLKKDYENKIPNYDANKVVEPLSTVTDSVHIPVMSDMSNVWARSQDYVPT